MPKATQADMEAMGFIAATFTGDDTSTWPAYIQKVLDAAALEVREAVGETNYAAASGSVTFARVSRLEVLYSAQELMSRAENISLRKIDGKSSVNYFSSSDRIKARDRYRQEFNSLLVKMGLSPFVWSIDENSYAPLPSIAVSSSSHFPETA